MGTARDACLGQWQTEGRPGLLRSLPLKAGDEPGGGPEVAGLIEKLGFAPIKPGKLAEGGRLQQFGGPLMVHNLLEQR
ncbi:NAD(P)-binding domain-containing protein [Archangium lipolyticum]|uniref:hypothetical protein n=1 Tax=Archangium lipolyticum TaxID=2970465 RepID=UPI0038992EB4